MGKKKFLGVLNKSLKKQSREKRQDLEESIQNAQETDAIEREEPEPVASYNTAELPVRCMGHNCEYVSYKNVDGMTALWCSKTKKTVYNMRSCPFEKWYKDEESWPYDN